MGESRRVYTDEERANALAACHANGGNTSKTAKELGIPQRTLAHWLSCERRPHAAKMGLDRAAALEDELKELAYTIVGVIPEKLKRAPLSQATAALNVTIDKLIVLRSQLGAQNQHPDYEDRLQRLRERYGQAHTLEPEDIGEAAKILHPELADVIDAAKRVDELTGTATADRPAAATPNVPTTPQPLPPLPPVPPPVRVIRTTTPAPAGNHH